MKTLPPELLNLVLSQLVDDRQSLLQCCLTASHWLFPSRARLFRNLSFHVGEGSDDFRRLFALLDVLDSTPLLWYHIHDIELWDCLVPIVGQLEMKCSTIASIMERIPSPHSFSLYYAEWLFVPPFLQSGIKQMMRRPSFTTLSMDRFTSFPWDELPSFISSSQNLTRLHVGEVYQSRWNSVVHGHRSDITNQRVEPLQLKALSLPAPFLHTNWLLSGSSPLNLSYLQELRVDFGRVTRRSFLGQLLETVGPSLQKLTIMNPWPEEGVPKTTGMQMVPHIHTLIIESTLWCSYLPWVEKFFYLPPTDKHPLRSLIITLGIHADSEDSKFKVHASTTEFWEVLDKIFTRPCYDSLREVVVRLKSTLWKLGEGHVEALLQAFRTLQRENKVMKVFLQDVRTGAMGHT